MDHLPRNGLGTQGNNLLGTAGLYLLLLTLLVKTYARVSSPRKRRRITLRRLSPQSAALACISGPIPVILQVPDKSVPRFPHSLLAIACVAIAIIETGFVHADLREELAQILHDNDVVLARNVLFQRRAHVFPHRLNILAASTLSYGALERAPTFLERASDQLKVTLRDLERANSTRSNLAEPAILPKYAIPFPDNQVGIHEARLQCEAMGLTLASPRNTTELRELQAWALQHGAWTAPNERIWLDCEFSLHEQAFINMLTKERLDLIYPGVDAKADHSTVNGWTHNLDDHTSHPALILQSGQLDFTQVKGISMYGDGYGRGYIDKNTGGMAPVSHVVCQSMGMKRDNVLISGELVSARELYAKQNARLPLEALTEMDNFMSALAIEQRRKITQLIERYGLRRLPQTVIPPLVSQSIVPVDISVPTPDEPIAPNKSHPATAPEQNPVTRFKPIRVNSERKARDTSTDWNPSDDVDRVLLSVAKAVPVLGWGVDAVDSIIRMRKLHSFKQTTTKRLRDLERTIAKSARRLSEVKFAADVLDIRTRHLELSVSQMQAHVSATLMTLELNQKLDLVMAEAQALHAEFLTEIAKFDRWLSALQNGRSPDQLFSGTLLASVRELIRDLGLDARSELQNTASTLVQDPIRIDALQIISNIRVSDVPWNLYEMLILPLWSNDHLFQEQVDYKYVAIDRDHTNYIRLTEQEYSRCHDNACVLPNPVRPLRTAECGPIALINSPSPKCNINELPNANFYAPFGSALAYSVKTPQQLSLICPYSDTTPRRKTITGAGSASFPGVATQQLPRVPYFTGPLPQEYRALTLPSRA